VQSENVMLYKTNPESMFQILKPLNSTIWTINQVLHLYESVLYLYSARSLCIVVLVFFIS